MILDLDNSKNLQYVAENWLSNTHSLQDIVITNGTQ